MPDKMDMQTCFISKCFEYDMLQNILQLRYFKYFLEACWVAELWNHQSISRNFYAQNVLTTPPVKKQIPIGILIHCH